jgi:hypothetical protein
MVRAAYCTGCDEYGEYVKFERIKTAQEGLHMRGTLFSLEVTLETGSRLYIGTRNPNSELTRAAAGKILKLIEKCKEHNAAWKQETKATTKQPEQPALDRLDSQGPAERSETIPPSKEHWRCKTCTFFNKGWRNKCEMCASDRDAPVSASSLASLAAKVSAVNNASHRRNSSGDAASSKEIPSAPPLVELHKIASDSLIKPLDEPPAYNNNNSAASAPERSNTEMGQEDNKAEDVHLYSINVRYVKRSDIKTFTLDDVHKDMTVRDVIYMLADKDPKLKPEPQHLNAVVEGHKVEHSAKLGNASLVSSEFSTATLVLTHT